MTRALLRAVPPTLLALAPLAPPKPAAAQGPGAGAPDAVEGVDYRVYDSAGARASLADIVAAARTADVLLVGEEHDDMPGHAFEAVLLDASADALAGAEGGGRGVVLSLEMFERDVQYIVDEYLADLVSEAHFLRSSRPWDDYEARYRPLVESAKRRGAPVVAANAPRRYVSRVTEHGPQSLEALSDLAKSYLPPLPYPGPSDRYRAEWDALMAEAMTSGETEPSPSSSDTATAAPDHSMSSGAIYAQALWDAAMGHAITTALVEHLGSLVVHFAGSFHVARGTGIPERIADYRPGTRVTTVVIAKAGIDGWSDEEHAGLADFVVLTPKPPGSSGGG